MSIYERSLASLKAKESGTTTLLVGVASVWMAGLSSGVMLPNADAMKINTTVYKPEFSQDASCQVSMIVPTSVRPAYVPKTALGKELAALRAEAIARGMRLLTADEISEEIAQRRGETT